MRCIRSGVRRRGTCAGTSRETRTTKAAMVLQRRLHLSGKQTMVLPMKV